MQKLRYEVDRLCASGFVLEQNQTVALLLQHLLGFCKRVGMFKVGRERAAGSLKDFANQVEIFFFVAHQQDPQRCWRQGGFSGSRH
jgi:hypothetical protein